MNMDIPNPQNRKFYDEAFTEIFSNRKIIESLLRDFVDESWVSRIDFNTMSIRKSVFKGIRKVKRESDLLITFQLKDGSGFSLFLLIEFQSSPEKMIELFDLLGRYIAGLMEYRGVETTGINDYSNKKGKPMLAQSMDKLIEESIQKGREEGIERGMEQAKLEDARKMLDKGYRMEDIYDITGLSKEEVEKLKKQK